MSESFDILVVGAGPGGLAAAATAAEAGRRVCLIDDNPAPGGQIWRRGLPDDRKNTPAIQWLYRIEQAGVVLRSGWRIVDAPPKTLRIEHEGQFLDLRYSSLILATGARELFLPFPGWTLPGIYGAGGLQAFQKSGLDVRGKRIVVAGTGPLLLAVAANLHSKGATIAAVVEQAPFTRLAKFALRLFNQPGKLLEGASYASHLLGVPYLTDAWVTKASGDQHLQRVTIVSGTGSFTGIEADMLAIGYHLIPNTELPELLGCELEKGYVRVDALQQTSVEGIYCAGEVTGIGGADKALAEGRIAALAACGKSAEAREHSNSRDRQLRFAQSLNQAFALRDELRSLPTEETLVCRCEDVTHGALAACNSWRQAKLHTRCGMGPCQGRVCGPAAHFLYGWEPPRPRPPLFPVEVAALAAQPSDDPQPL